MPAITLVVRGSGRSSWSGLCAAWARRFSLRYVDRAEFAATECTQVEKLLRPEYVSILVAMLISASWAGVLGVPGVRQHAPADPQHPRVDQPQQVVHGACLSPAGGALGQGPSSSVWHRCCSRPSLPSLSPGAPGNRGTPE